MISFPNQNRVLIHKNRYRGDFLQIGIDEWQEASKELTPSAFKIYLYLAGNADGFFLALSKQDIKNRLNISFTRYYEAINLLQRKKYLCKDVNNTLHFFTTPNPKFESQHSIQNWENPNLDIFDPKSTALDPFVGRSFPKTDIEIYKKYNIDNDRYCACSAVAGNRTVADRDGLNELAKQLGF